MKPAKLIMSLTGMVLLISVVSCNTNKTTNCSMPNSYELHKENMLDTVNMIDCHGWKQGKWITTLSNKMKETLYYRNDTVMN